MRREEEIFCGVFFFIFGERFFVGFILISPLVFDLNDFCDILLRGCLSFLLLYVVWFDDAIN